MNYQVVADVAELPPQLLLSWEIQYQIYFGNHLGYYTLSEYLVEWLNENWLELPYWYPIAGI